MRVCTTLILAGCVAAGWQSLAASDTHSAQPLRLTQYAHTAWLAKDGFRPDEVTAITQTNDGYLWIGSGSGLYRFDGVRFTPWEASAPNRTAVRGVSALFASRSGALWIADDQGLLRVVGAKITRFPLLRGTTHELISNVLEDRRGRLWAALVGPSGSGLVRIIHDQVERIGPGAGIPAGPAFSLLEDRAGNLWIGTRSKLCRWNESGPPSCLGERQILALTEDQGGNLLLGDATRAGISTLQNGRFVSAFTETPPGPVLAKVMLCDREGSTWAGTLGRGLVRWTNGHPESFTRRDGLSGELVEALFEDREGNVWAGTDGGLDRFRIPTLPRVTSLEGLSGDLITAVCASRDGSVWVGTAASGLNRISTSGVERFSTGAGLLGNTITALNCEDPGRVWVGSASGTAYREHGRFFSVTDAGGAPVRDVFGFAPAPKGMWLAQDNKAIFHASGRVADAVSLPANLRRDLYVLRSSRDGALWVGHYQGGVTEIKGGSTRSYFEQDGVAPGAVTALYDDSRGALWAGTSHGLSLFDGAHWRSWTAASGFPDEEVRGIVEDNNRSIWIATINSVWRVSTYPGATTSKLELSRFNFPEELRLGVSGNQTGPRMARSTDGRLWIGTNDGVAVIDPARIPRKASSPPVLIETLSQDGVALQLDGKSAVRTRGSELRIKYTANILARPEKVLFRYELIGFKAGWTDAGNLRETVYTNLRPGNYQFCVAASEAGGLWGAPACRDIQVLPRFYQSIWFGALCLLLISSAIWMSYRVRVRQIRGRFNVILEERLRLARELHDTLLQGFAGLTLQLEAANRNIDKAPEKTKQMLDRTIRQAEESLGEARRAIHYLRLKALDEGTLSEALSQAGTQLTQHTGIDFQLRKQGDVDGMPYDVEGTAYLMAREAIRNAVRHAEPKRISVDVARVEKGLRVVVEDDGRGFDPAGGGVVMGRWGLKGMRERATTFGATLSLESSPGAGTRLELWFPASRLERGKRNGSS